MILPQLVVLRSAELYDPRFSVTACIENLHGAPWTDVLKEFASREPAEKADGVEAVSRAPSASGDPGAAAPAKSGGRAKAEDECLKCYKCCPQADVFTRMVSNDKWSEHIAGGFDLFEVPSAEDNSSTTIQFLS